MACAAAAGNPLCWVLGAVCLLIAVLVLLTRAALFILFFITYIHQHINDETLKALSNS